MANVRRFCCDDETGEIVTYSINQETGEPLENSSGCVSASPGRTERFVTFRTGYSTNYKKFQTLKANIIAGSNRTSPRLFLIPTLMIFPGFLTIMIAILEIYLHVRCHKRNKSLKDCSLYYRSPFHMVTSIFCGVCRESETASKVGQLQDQRRHRHDYLRSLAL